MDSRLAMEIENDVPISSETESGTAVASTQQHADGPWLAGVDGRLVFAGDVRARGPRGELIPEPWEFSPTPRRSALGPFARWPHARHATLPLVFALLFFAVSLLQWSVPSFNGAASGSAVYAQGEAWRLFSALFAHGSLGHLASNLLPFLFFGWMIQAYFGFWLFPVFSFAVGLVSDAVTVALYPPTAHLLGASGMIYGMIALWLVLYLRFDKDRRVPVRIVRAAGFALLLLFPTTYEPQVSYLAHASGFAAGMAGGFIVAPFVSPRHPS